MHARLPDFSALESWSHWWGFWCAAASLLLLAAAARRSRSELFPRRRRAPAMGLGLAVLFAAYSMPGTSNRLQWLAVPAGLKARLEIKAAKAREGRGGNLLHAAFQGRWKSAEGASLEIRSGRVRLKEGRTVKEFGESACEGAAPYVRYETGDRSGVGYHFHRAGMVTSPLFRELPEGRYPLLTCICKGRNAAFIVVEPGRLVAVLEDGTLLTFWK